MILRTVVLTCVLLLPAAARAEFEEMTVRFQPHAAFFSAETSQPKPIDPQVFVQDAAAPAGTGPQGIAHAAGFRPALIAEDPADTKLFNATGAPLGFTLGEWLGAGGSVTITQGDVGTATLVLTLRGLRPGAQYSLFENHFDQSPVGFTPLDGAGKTNSFKADASGGARVIVTSPTPLSHANAVLVILDDDGQTHGESRGEIGVNVQHQLIARPPI
jgi:hypothetical protein